MFAGGVALLEIGWSAIAEWLGTAIGWAVKNALWAALSAAVIAVVIVPAFVFVWRRWVSPQRKGDLPPPPAKSPPLPFPAPDAPKPRLVLFVHGLAGSASKTWQSFPDLISKDEDLAKLYDVALHEYPTELTGGTPSLPLLADDLRTTIETRYAHYGEIAIIAHSQGGLIAMRAIADAISTGQAGRVRRLLTFATPFHGSLMSNVLEQFGVGSQPSRALAVDSDFLQAVHAAWAQARGEARLITRYVIAGKDRIVPATSAKPHWNVDYDVVANEGHDSIVKPASPGAPSFVIARKLLLQEDVQPGAADADYRPPLLRLNSLDPATRGNLFTYSARAIDMLGREADLARLDDFLASPEQPFQWMILHGSGGMGKSRLALEHCLRQRGYWHVGFLERDGREPDWIRWQPLLPTLIVIDYAALDTERTGRILRALSGRGSGDGTAWLGAPVRLLLIERTGGGDWLDRAVGSGTAAKRVAAARAEGDLALAAVPPWPIITAVLAARKSATPPPEAETLAALRSIDPEQRPLFAMLVADAIADGRPVHALDRDALLQDVIGRWRDKFWRPAGATPGDERLLAVATLAGGLPRAVIDRLSDPLLPAWDIDRHPAVLETMTGQPAGEGAPPLTPDIVGEHFTLSVLADPKLSTADRRRLLAHAWGANPLGVAQFSVRAHRDLPDAPMLADLRRAPAEAHEPILLWAMAGVDLMVDLPNRDSTAARDLLDDMRAVADERKEASLWEQWAKAATNLMVDLPTRDSGAARDLLDDMRAVAKTRDEAAVWEVWAKAAFNLLDDLRTRDSTAARDLLDDMRTVAETRDEAALWEEWAKAATNLMGDLRTRDSTAARALLDDMRAVADKRKEAALWEQWAKAATNLVLDLPTRDSKAARDLLDDMRAVADKR
ncbi:MAG: esterase/lipase family protein, partial [Hyphomicrobiaceae bacterium]